MAKPLNLKSLTEEERGVLIESIPILRKLEGDYWWQDAGFKEQYKKWLEVTDSSYQEGGFDQFRLGIYQMRKMAPLTYKTTKDMKNVN